MVQHETMIKEYIVRKISTCKTYICLSLLIVGILGSCSILVVNRIVPDKIVMPYSKGSQGHLLVDGFMFDTGASASLVFEMDESIKQQVKKEGEINHHGQYKEDFYSISSFSIGAMLLKHFHFIYINKNHTNPIFTNTLGKGLLGMDVISKANWTIDNVHACIRMDKTKNKGLKHGDAFITLK